MSDVPQERKVSKEFIGKFALLYRNKIKTPVHVLDVFEKDGEHRIAYEILGGKDKGKKFCSRYYEGQLADLYDEGNLLLCLMEG